MNEIYHLIGLGGIGMSALARILLQKGKKVQGSDLKESPLLTSLAQEGAQVSIGHSAANIQEGSTVIYSTDIQKENPEIKQARELGLSLIHRADFLDSLIEQQKPLLVTGAHGKTTTTALLSWVLLQGKIDPSFVIGGILSSENTNARYGKGPFFVLEADESDGSFLKTIPWGAIVTNFDKEHLSFWKTEAFLAAAFQQFFKHCQEEKHLFWCYDDEKLRMLTDRGISYGFSEGADLQIVSYQERELGIVFDLQWQDRRYRDIEIPLMGRHQALNASAVFGLLISLGVAEEVIYEGLKTFRGTKRRLEWKGKERTVDLFDDYGHHPNEIKATLKALRSIAKERRIVALFQPHRYTRIAQSWDDFGSAFDDADVVLMTDIYASNESPIPGISTEAFFQKLKESLGDKLRFVSRSNIVDETIAQMDLFDVVMTIGAGDITDIGKKILNAWPDQKKKMRVAVVFGGESVEHPVSLLSAETILASLNSDLFDIQCFGIDRNGRWMMGPDALTRLKQGEMVSENRPFIASDILQTLSLSDVAIPVMHGTCGEDGMIQGLLDSLHIPYVGSDFRASSLCMHKGWTKQVASMHGIPVAPFIQIKKKDSRAVEIPFDYPVWVKPVHLGSSIGVRYIANQGDLAEALASAFCLDDCLLIEKHIEGREIEFGVIGNEWIRVGAPSEVMKDSHFLDYEGKYGAHAAEIIVPAKLSSVEESLGKELASKVYQILGCKGLCRIDFFLSKEGHYWLNEANPFPGCTATSAFPKIWKASHMSMEEVCNLLVVFALHRVRI
jgi:UDP-N-acetylmuramate--alanine ligase